MNILRITRALDSPNNQIQRRRFFLKTAILPKLQQSKTPLLSTDGCTLTPVRVPASSVLLFFSNVMPVLYICAFPSISSSSLKLLCV
jgi:hypothetical protein